MSLYKGINDFTGEIYQFEITQVQLDDIDGAAGVKFHLSTPMGESFFLEWINEEKVARTDRHIIINELYNLSVLFDLSNKPSFMPVEDYLPINEIKDALDALIHQ